MRKSDLIKLIFFSALAILIVAFVWPKSKLVSDECISNLSSLNYIYEIDNAPLKSNLNIDKSESYFVFKTQGLNSLIYYLLLETNEGYELHEFYQFGGWEVKALGKKEGRHVFVILINLFNEPKEPAALLHNSCAVAELNINGTKVLKEINTSHPLSNKIFEDIWKERQNMFNIEMYLVRLEYIEKEELKDDVFFELRTKKKE